METERRLAGSKETGKPVGGHLRRRAVWAEPRAGGACFERRVNTPTVTRRGEQLQCRHALTGDFRGKRGWKGAFLGALLTLLETERRLAGSKETGKPVGGQLRRRGLVG